jgi:aspartyl-tRNA(Asn)/glutamyl-tRNA(Gln) amidotransferase subunit A
MKLTLPRISGPPLRLARIAAESRGSAGLVRQLLRHALRVDELAALPAELRGDLPFDHRPIRARKDSRSPGQSSSGRALREASREGSHWPHRASDYVRAFESGRSSPRQVAMRALLELSRLATLRPTMNVLAASDPAMTLADAESSTRRYAAKKTLGPLDGVPFLVKDQHDVRGLPTRVGSHPGSEPPAARDATLVARLRAAGAVVLGKSVLTEWAFSTVGANVHVPMPHNPFDPSRAAGGSSTGSAVGVALGLCPLATGGDGGGSIRVPACLNGIFGLKPTFGRVSRAGDWLHGSTAVVGPVACSTIDLAHFLDAVSSSPDPDDLLTEWADPPPRNGFANALSSNVRGLTIGIDHSEWQDAAPEIAKACETALSSLEHHGAKIVSIEIPLAPSAAQIGYLSIGAEGLTYGKVYWEERRDVLGEDLRLALAAISGVTAVEYLDSQRLRQGLRLEVAEALRKVDVLALPTTAIAAPRYTERDASDTFTDPAALDGLCRYAFLANVTGLPAGTAPIGVDSAGLPIGLQIVGDAWDESRVLGVLANLEREEVAQVRRPACAVDLLDALRDARRGERNPQ